MKLKQRTVPDCHRSLGRVPKVAAPIFFYRGRELGCVENARNTYSIPCAFLLAISLPLRKIRALRLLGHALATTLSTLVAPV